MSAAATRRLVIASIVLGVVLLALPFEFDMPIWLNNARASFAILFIVALPVAFDSGRSSNEVGRSTFFLLLGIGIESGFALFASAEPPRCGLVAQDPLLWLLGIFGLLTKFPWQSLLVVVLTPLLVYYHLARVSHLQRAIEVLSLFLLIGLGLWLVGSHWPSTSCD